MDLKAGFPKSSVCQNRLEGLTQESWEEPITCFSDKSEMVLLQVV